MLPDRLPDRLCLLLPDRKMPEPPKEMAELPIGGGKMSTAQLDAYNLKAFNTFETESLNTCPYCSRTFK